MTTSRWIAAVGLGATLLLPSAAAKTKISSAWLDREIVVDGELDEWRDALQFVKPVEAFVAMLNDDEALYLCLYVRNPQTASRFTESGIRARFEGGDGEFVVFYPPGESPALQLQVPGKRDPVVVAPTGEAGIEAAASHRGSFVFELKLPLSARDDRTWTPGLRPGERFKLVLANPQIDELSEERALRENGHAGTVSPLDPQGGDRVDPSWAGRSVRRDEIRFVDEYLFVLKARVDLAGKP